MWSPGSPNLALSLFYLWGRLKDGMYKQMQTIAVIHGRNMILSVGASE
jgi:hypothetical protein